MGFLSNFSTLPLTVIAVASTLLRSGRYNGRSNALHPFHRSRTVTRIIGINCTGHSNSTFCRLFYHAPNGLLKKTNSRALSSIPISHSKPNLMHQFSACPYQCLPLDMYRASLFQPVEFHQKSFPAVVLVRP